MFKICPKSYSKPEKRYYFMNVLLLRMLSLKGMSNMRWNVSAIIYEYNKFRNSDRIEPLQKDSYTKSTFCISTSPNVLYCD